MTTCRMAAFLALAALSLAGPAAAQSPSAAPAWSFRVSASTYLIPDDENYVQPTVTADRGALHLESRFNYEDRDTVSGFVGWNINFGSTVEFTVTPMVGASAGLTDAFIPGLELDVTWRRLEFYSEGEYVIPYENRGDRFFYNWSELSLWPTEWLRVGMVTQRTRVFETDRDLQRGVLVGLAASRIEGAFYLFNPGAADQFSVIAVTVSF